MIDFYVDCPADKRDELVESLSHLRVWVEENHPDNRLWLQGHSDVSEDLVKSGYSFEECVSGSVWDLWVEHDDGQETLYCNDHGGEDKFYYDLTVDEYNEVYENMNEEDYRLVR